LAIPDRGIVYAQTAAGQQVADSVSVEWLVPQSALQAAINSSHFEGTIKPGPNTPQDKAVPVLVILAGVVAISYLADALVTVAKSIAYGGTIIDATVTPISIKHDTAMRAGTIVIFTANTPPTFIDSSNADAASQLLKILREANFKSLLKK
jgi:hypothetical protein